MTTESAIKAAVERLRENGYGKTSWTTQKALANQDSDGDGRLDDNPDTGAGSEPGFIVVEIRDDEGTHVLDVGEESFEWIKSEDSAYAFLLDLAKIWGPRDLDEPK